MERSLGTWLGGCLLVSVWGLLPPPKNVRMDSVNFKNILRWEAPDVPQGNLTFTVQSQSYRGFHDKCANTSETECDFTDLSKYGNHDLRVRTESAGSHSDWVNITFCPVDNTTIGPLGLQVDVLANNFFLRFSSPRIANEPQGWTVRSVYSTWLHNVQYWKNGSDEKISLSFLQDLVILRNLEPWTTYCVQVRVFVSEKKKNGQWTEPVCEQTGEDETIPSWVIALGVLGASFCVVLLLFFCFLLLLGMYRKTKYALWPRSTLPQHLKEFWGQPHHNTLLLFSFPLAEEEEAFDKLSVVTQAGPASRQGSRDGGPQGAPEPTHGGETDWEGQRSPLLPLPDPQADRTARSAEAT